MGAGRVGWVGGSDAFMASAALGQQQGFAVVLFGGVPVACISNISSQLWGWRRVLEERGRNPASRFGERVSDLSAVASFA